MTIRRLLGLLSLAIMLQADAAMALGKAPQVWPCPDFARLWIGTLGDRRKIDSVPVPVSFRDLLYKDVCTSRSLVKGGLIAWNLSFGTERTTTTALAFLRDFYTKRLSKSDRRGLFRDWRSELATLYLQAAEFYESRPLLEEALVYIAQSQTRIVERSPGTSESNVSNNLTSDLGLRAAVLKARLSRSPEDIDGAQALLDGHYVPVYRDAAEFVTFNGEKGFCTHAGNANKEKIYAACNGGITNFESGLREFWLYQAQLDLLKAPAPRAYDLLRNTGPHGADDRSGSSFVKRDPADNEVKTRLGKNIIQSVWYARAVAGPSVGADPNPSLQARALDLGFLYAEFYARWSALPEYWARWPNQPESKAGYLKLAMSELERLERYVSAARNPGRFRQIAMRYLRYYDELKALPASARTPFDRQTVEPSNALYYRTVLKALEQIRKGASGPNKEAP